VLCGPTLPASDSGDGPRLLGSGADTPGKRAAARTTRLTASALRHRSQTSATSAASRSRAHASRASSNTSSSAQRASVPSA